MDGRSSTTRGRPWFGALLAAEGASRLIELRISRSREARLRGPRTAPAGYRLMVALHVALFALPPLEVFARRPRARRPLLWTGLLAAAAGLRWWSIASLGPSWNVRAAVPAGLTPVTSGPYRFIRHPNYLAVAIEFAALPLAGGARFSAVLLSALNVAVLAARIRAEEALLRAVPGYEAAFSGRARFIPGLF